MFTKLFDALSHLSVTTIATSVAEHFTQQMVPIVTSDVSSGKTMLIPAQCVELIGYDPTDPQNYDPTKIVYVLEPTRFLAMNAAESLRSILGPENENLVGCINSNRSEEDSILHPHNRIIFTTVGYALAAGLLIRMNNFILDEAHETSIDLSLTKALLHHRRQKGDLINLAVLSATIDITNELEYWGDKAVHFTTEGSAFPVTFYHRPAQQLSESVMELITDYDRKGILVFVAGIEEIENAIDEIKVAAFANELDLEISSIHGNSTANERKIASLPRQSAIKVLVGTNVLESGVNLPWVDSGVSSGDTKIMYAHGNARRLAKEELPRWRIRQQTGRVRRFSPGVFILSHPKALELRPEMTKPDIVRLPLTELIMHCATLPDIHIHDLVFSKTEQPKPEAITAAIKTLVEYGLIAEESNEHLVLTDEGRMIENLPISYRAAAAYCEAVKLGMVPQMLPLIAMLDQGDLRHIFREPMRGYQSEISDPIYQLKTVAQYFFNWRDIPYKRRREVGEMYNISFKKLQEFSLLLEDLEKKTKTRSDWSPYYKTEENEDSSEFNLFTKQIIFRAMINQTYVYNNRLGGSVSFPAIKDDGQVFTVGDIGINSNFEPWRTSDEVLAVAGDIRIITTKDRAPRAVLEFVTAFTKNDIQHLIKRFGKSTFERISGYSVFPTELGVWLSGGHRMASSMRRAYGEIGEQPPEPMANNEPETPVKGTFGALLEQALTKIK